MRKLRELVRKNYIFVSPELPLRALCQRMAASPQRVPVYSDDEQFYIIDPIEIVRALATYDENAYATLTAADLSRPTPAVEFGTNVREAAKILLERSLDRLLVLRDNKIWGTVGETALAKEILRLEIGQKVYEEIQARRLTAAEDERDDESTGKVRAGLSEAVSNEQLRSTLEEELEETVFATLYDTFESMFGAALDGAEPHAPQPGDRKTQAGRGEAAALTQLEQFAQEALESDLRANASSKRGERVTGAVRGRTPTASGVESQSEAALGASGLDPSQATSYTTEPPLIEQFLDRNDEPLRHLNDLFAEVERRGFKLDDKSKSYLRHVVFKRSKSLDKKLQAFKERMEVSDTASKAMRHQTSRARQTEKRTAAPPAKRNASGSGKRTGTETIAILYSDRHHGHRSAMASPENPERIKTIMNLLQGRADVFTRNCTLYSHYPPAEPEDILRVHTKRHLEFVENYSRRGGGFLGDSTYMTQLTYELALLAAGGALKAAKLVLDDKAEYAVALIRPPGHHATADSFGGYCIFNNSAILARHLQTEGDLRRIMIIDWDAHAGNGTMDIFYRDPSVLCVSLHQDPTDFYPNTGFTDQIGEGAGRGYTVNLPMPKYAGDEEYRHVFEEIVIPLIEAFVPHFIIGCNGFDAHYKEPTSKLQLTTDGYYTIATLLREHLRSKSAILMEGGYHRSNGRLTLAQIDALSGLPDPFPNDGDGLVINPKDREHAKRGTYELVTKMKAQLAEYYYGF